MPCNKNKGNSRLDPFDALVRDLCPGILQSQGILAYVFVGGYESQAFCQGLSDQHSIKGISMVWRETSRQLPVKQADRELAETLILHNGVHIFRGFKLAKSHFYGNFPSRSSADKNLIATIGDNLPASASKFR
jgi:hypothetical protein